MVMVRPFFIVGADRSGTTMLRLMLNEHSDVHVPRETWFLTNLMDALPLNTPLDESQLGVAYKIITEHERWCDLEIGNSQLKLLLEQIEEPDLSDLVCAIYKILLLRTGKSRWGDKTPDYVKEINRLNQLFPGAQFIHVIRDGRDVCLSLLKKRWRGTVVPTIARYWSDCVSAGIAAGRNLPCNQYLEIFYEDLTTETEITLRKICDFLDIDFQENMLKFYEHAADNIADWEKEHHQKTTRAPQVEDIYRWKIEASPFQVLAVEAIAGSTMEQVGQERKFKGIGKVLPWSFGAIEASFWHVLSLRRKIRNNTSKLQKH